MSIIRFRNQAGAGLLVLAAISLGVVPGVEAQDNGLPTVTVKDARDVRFGEILVVKEDAIDIYNTTGLNDCPARLWDALDIEKLKKEYGAKAIQKNGPHYWMMDSQTFSVGKKASFGGIEARWVARLNPADLDKSDKGSEPYKVFKSKKTQKMVYSKGKAVFELFDPDGHVYVLQAREERFPIDSLPKLGDQMKKLPKGWQYRNRTLGEDLVLDLRPDQTIYVVGDEFHQYYTRIPEAK